MQFKLPDGWTTARTTHETARGRAESWAIEYLKAGNIISKHNITLSEFSKDFFAWESPWATNKRITGKRISRHHCLDCAGIMKNHILPILGNMKLTQITEHAIEKFRNDIFKSGYSGNTTNRVLMTLREVLKAAKKQSLIQFVPEVEQVAERPKKKGILTIEEVKKIFSIEWNDFRGYAGNILACSTGLRIGELQALVISDIHLDDGYIHVRRSYDKMFGLTETTKTGRARNIFIPQRIKEVLRDLISVNPHPENPESFIFCGEKVHTKPVETKYFYRALYRALAIIGIDEAERKRRNLSFHSWRYFFNSLLINAKIPLQKIQSMTGHLTDEMTQHYYHIDDMADVVETVQNVLFKAIN